MWELLSTIDFTLLHYRIWYYSLEKQYTVSSEQLARYITRSESSSFSRHRYKPPLLVSIPNMATALTVAWELVRLHLHNRRQPPYSKPSKPVSGDGKSHSTNFCDRSIIMQTAVTNTLIWRMICEQSITVDYYRSESVCPVLIF